MVELDCTMSVSPQTIMMDGENKITDPAKIAEMINSFFSNIVTKYITAKRRPMPNYDKLPSFIHCKVPSDAMFDIPPIHEDFVLKELNSLDPQAV